ncbi:hypothetical protein JK636_01545 [Clostridium sp. YIM B02515]|uniref:Transmembrane protein n=1 Tax=Clostridium rhizosphaerae TaxID=2803861 RepID=A0ABS1T5N4_9CLOT|nr:hypothetical protein [Clostridium rhizosphaerae]
MFRKYIFIIFVLLAIIIISYVLFKYPRPGVADQGDFNRVMFASGLQLTDEDKNNPNLKRYLDYIITDYKMPDKGVPRMFVGIIGTTVSVFTTIGGIICRILGRQLFSTEYLAGVYCLVYLFSIIMILKYINIKGKVKCIIVCLLTLFIFFDGNYLVWFNSLYGEPAMITTFMLYLSSWMYYIYCKEVLKESEKIFSKIILIFIASLMFIGSKLQVISALPVVSLMFAKLIWDNRNMLTWMKKSILLILLIILVAYPIDISLIHKPLSEDTNYNSVFYGILKDSKNPRQDLIDLGLNTDMVVEAGKNSYSPTKDYVKYIPHTEITEKEFYSRMSNGKLIKFYITHPLRLIQGMEYTAAHSFDTSTYLGKYKRSYSEVPIRKFDRFTTWSSLRLKCTPKKLVFIVLIYIIILASSILIYLRNRLNTEVKAKIQLFWAIFFISILQFPMSYMGNGQADTSKQLYLFNFTFDIIIFASVLWCLNNLIKKKIKL